ncbi:DUF5682 family protein [Membranihabitans marinus]|uniref:DUF5682 family protein n=1 Tax=Membranihabitans marinus TaxID=1227546 RepID=UPI001F24BADF|nr:DUF5682 family protein [Membranihabitans marinus]
MNEVKLLGIRHHGPGSALRIQRMLDEYGPDIILLEAPADAQHIIASFNPYEMTPPIAGLIYDPKDFQRAAYFPLAAFSPEWIALKYSFDQKIPLRCIDLPIGAILKQKNQRSRPKLNPFYQLAKISGFNDVEQWWDHFLETTTDSTAIFDHIAKLMRELRKDATESSETIQREAFMVEQIQMATGEDFKKIAVICGAYHLPALENHKNAKPSKKSVRIKMIKTDAVWIPWSYRRMKQENGYGAGISNPTWYHALFEHKEEAAMYWITECGKTLRAVKPLSTAHTIETINLARGLKNLRNKSSIGIPELEDAITTVMYEGDPSWKEVFGDKIFTGHQTGSIPNDLFILPLQLDFRKMLKSGRLSKLLEEPIPMNKTLDLRTSKHLLLSCFFYQTLTLEIPLAKIQDQSISALGNFKEIWDLQWDPVSEWILIQVSSYGNTIEAAARNKITDALTETEIIDDVIDLLDQSFMCGFDDLLDIIKSKLLKSYIHTDSVLSLLKSVNTLIHVQSYGHIRWSKPPELTGLLDRMIYKVSIMLPAAIYSIDEDEIEELKQLINQLYFTLQSGRFPHLSSYMDSAWLEIYNHHIEIDYFSGRALRICMDLGRLDRSEIEIKISFVFQTSDANQMLAWLEGLFSGGILWLIYDDIFLSQLSEWMENMDTEIFYENLPMLRKTFGLTPESDRSNLYYKIKHGHLNHDSSQSNDIASPEVAERVDSLMQHHGL